MKVAFTADHRGLELKNRLMQRIAGQGHEITDLGAFQHDANDDYPDFAALAAKAISSGQAARCVAVCGSGVGLAVAANKHRGVRAAVCHDAYSAKQGVEHDDMNVLCLGAVIVGEELALVLVETFLEARFNGGAKFQRRLNKVLELDRHLP